MVENDWDVVSFAYAGESGPQDWNDLDGGTISTNGICKYISDGCVTWDWWSHIAFRLRNGQIIRVKKKEPK